MASVSKPLFGKISHVDCSKIAHPWSDHCGNGFLYMWWSSFKGSAKFLLIIYVAQYLMKRKKLTIEQIRETLLHYFRESLFGACMGSTFVTSMCFFRNSLQRFNYYTLALLPASLGGIAIFLVDSSRRGFSTTTFQYLALEAIYKYLQRIGVVTNSSLTETLGFMACSSCLLYVLRAGHHHNLRTLMWSATHSYLQFIDEKTEKQTSYFAYLYISNSNCKRVLFDLPSKIVISFLMVVKPLNIY
ncbi:transmembrane protein 135-like [Nilaparvata lugens]|uniref:transmembrane protein 135-like n=1 Tax=Nilaparvata lugens TaxID=108931 RepID=UPI00193CD15B|nr:transmembrane protein 135-like [Nilaparvata lugens]